jgi:hypothetical protein
MLMSPFIALLLLSGKLLSQEVITSAYEQKTVHLDSPDPTLPSVDLVINSSDKAESKKRKMDLEKRGLLNVVKGAGFIFKAKAFEKDLGLKSSLCDRLNGNIEHTPYLGSESVSPFVIYQVHIPINTLTGPSQSFSLKMNSGNSMVHNSILKDPNNKTRTINFDAVTEKHALTYTHPLGNKTEAFIVLSFYSASEKGLLNPMNWIVSDSFIESYHKKILGRDDVYKRKELGFDNFAYQSTDPDGKTFSLDKGEVYVYPLQLGATQYQTILKSEKSLMTVNGSIALQVPVSKAGPQQQIKAAAGTTISASKKISANNSLSAALHGSLKFNKLGTISQDKDAYDEGGTDTTYQVQALMGFNHVGKKGNSNSVYITYNRANLQLSTPRFSTTGNNLNQQAYQAATSGSEFLEVGLNKSLNLKNNKRLQIEFAIREDVFSNFSEIKTLGGHSLFVGRIAEDFGVFLGLRYQMGKTKTKE